MKCTICSHPKRKEINKALVSGNVSIRAIASQWHVGREALRRHVDNGHIAGKIQKAAAAKEMIEADDFLSYLEQKRARFREMATEAQLAKNPHLELKVYQVESKFGEMEGKARGAFRDKVEHTGKDGGPIQTEEVSRDKLCKVAEDILRLAEK